MNGDFLVGPWLVKPSLNSISCRNTTVRLEPKVMDVLICLAEHVGETLSKETLLDTVWPGTFVTDDVLTHSISVLRRAFGDDTREPLVIQTISKRGYRLVAQVSATSRLTPAPSVTPDSIAVLPFINMSVNPEDEVFAKGITEEIIYALAQIKQLHVAARPSAFSFNDKYADVRTVGRRLNVRTVLVGSVRRTGNEVRITVQLVNVADGYPLWSDRYDREVRDVFEIQDEIARSIAQRLKLILKVGEDERLVKAGTKNLEAYQLYMNGRALLDRRGGAAAQAAECFEREVALEADYARAWAGLADSYTVLSYYGHARPEANMPKAVNAARRAVALAPSLAEGHNALAMASLMGAWDREKAEQEFLTAIDLNPRYTQARDWYSVFYLQFSEGRLVEGMNQAKQALVFDPRSSYAHALYGMACGLGGKYTDAEHAARDAVELDPESYLAHMCLQGVLHFSGKLEESVAAGELALAMSGRLSWSMAILAVTLAKLGKPEDADAVYTEMVARARRQYLPPAHLAMAAAAASRKDEAIEHTREAIEIRDPNCLFFFSRHLPHSAPLYTCPRFREIIASIGRHDWL